MVSEMSAPTTDSAMYQTMHRQPSDLRRLLDSGWAPAEEAAGRLASARRVFTVGIGTSYHAALVGAWLLRALVFCRQAAHRNPRRPNLRGSLERPSRVLLDAAVSHDDNSIVRAKVG